MRRRPLPSSVPLPPHPSVSSSPLPFGWAVRSAAGGGLPRLGGVCGRYASARPVSDLAAAFGIEDDAVDEPLDPDFNVAPTKPVYAVVDRRPRHEPDGPISRRLVVMRWGLVPSWAKDPGIGSRLINARAETVAEKPAFRRAFESRRCLLPADGYYEWYDPDRPGERKQPFFIRPRGESLLALAGLYEFWRSGDDGEWLVTCTILTTSAPDDVGRVHDRAPLTVDRDRWTAWLDPERTGSSVAELLVPAVPGRLEAYPVGFEVNNVKNNGPQLLEPLAAS